MWLFQSQADGTPIEVLGPRGGSLGTGSDPFKESQINSQKLIKWNSGPCVSAGWGRRLLTP